MGGWVGVCASVYLCEKVDKLALINRTGWLGVKHPVTY